MARTLMAASEALARYWFHPGAFRIVVEVLCCSPFKLRAFSVSRTCMYRECSVRERTPWVAHLGVIVVLGARVSLRNHHCTRHRGERCSAKCRTGGNRVHSFWCCCWYALRDDYNAREIRGVKSGCFDVEVVVVQRQGEVSRPLRRPTDLGWRKRRASRRGVSQG